MKNFLCFVAIFISGCTTNDKALKDYAVPLSEFEQILLEAHENGLRGVLGCTIDGCKILLSDPELKTEPVSVPVVYRNEPGHFRLRLAKFAEFRSNWRCSEVCKLSNQNDDLYYHPYRGIILLSTQTNPLCYRTDTSREWCTESLDGNDNFCIILVPRKLD